MKEFYQLQEVTVLLGGISPKTLREWIKAAGLETTPNKRNPKSKLLSRAQVEHLAELHGRTLPLDTPAKAADPLAEMEARLRAFIKREIAAQIATLRTELLTPTRTVEAAPVEIPPLRSPQPRQADSPAALVQHARTKRKAFAADWRARNWLFEEHGIPPRSMEGWRDIPLESREAVLAYAETQGELPRRRCDDATCPCQNAAL